MKKILVLIFSSFLFIGFAVSQNITDYSDIRLETEGDYEAAEDAVYDAARYILSTAADGKDLRRFSGLQLIMTWMEDHPSYMFQLESMDILGDDINAKTAYIAAVAKYQIDNKNLEPDADRMKLSVWKTFLIYAANSENRVKQTKTLKKLMNAAETGDSELLSALK